MEITESEGTFQNERGQQIFYRDWYKPETQPRAMVVLSHGFGDHSGRLREVAQAFSARNYLTTCIDFVGMGKSDGPRALVKTIDHYVNDMVQHTREKQRKNPGLLTFLVGHSMGAHVALRTVMFHPDVFSGFISSAPALTINPRLVTPTGYLLARVTARLFPQVVVKKFDNTKMARDPSVMQKFERDELCYRGGLKAGWCYAMYYSMLYVLEHLERITTPVLALHGGDDVVCETKGSRLLIERVSSRDKTLKIYDGAYHSLFLEPDYREQVIADCIEWMDERSQSDDS